MYQDDQISSNEEFAKMQEEFKNKLEQKNDDLSSETINEDQKIHELFSLLTLTETHLTQIKNFLERKNFKVLIKNVDLENALQNTKLNKEQLIKEGYQISSSLQEKAPAFNNIKTSIYNCCNNQTNLLNLLLLLMLLNKNNESKTKMLNQIATHQVQTMSTLLKLF